MVLCWLLWWSLPRRGGARRESLQNRATARLARGSAKDKIRWCTLQTYIDDTFVSERVVGPAIPWVARVSFSVFSPLGLFVGCGYCFRFNFLGVCATGLCIRVKRPVYTWARLFINVIKPAMEWDFTGRSPLGLSLLLILQLGDPM